VVARVVIGIAVIAAIATGCIESGLVVCADGRACPAGLVCDDARRGCVTPEQVSVCAGLGDLAPCRTALILDGVCSGGVCLPAGCGNTVVEPGELCDDGNLVSGDGCSADCRSREVCGDGYADVSLGEQCDDGGTTGHDGCTAVCATEDMTWRRQDGRVPKARFLSKTVYDPFRHVLVAFGGQDGTFVDLGDTWEWNGAQWREVTPLFSPPPRGAHSLAYDPKRHRVVLFGGYNRVFGRLNDTWEYDGATWQRLRPSVSPSPRNDAAMAWDPAIGRVVLFGGTGGDAATWTWDGAQWSRIDTPHVFATAAPSGMVFDAARDRLLLFGATSGSSHFATGLWAFDGADWTEIVTTGGPTLSEFVADLVYDPIDGVPIAITDHFVGGVIVLDMWELNGTAWRPMLNADYFIVGVVIQTPSFTFDLVTEKIVEWSGMTPTGPVNSLTGYAYDAGWSDIAVPQNPPRRLGTALAYDPERARVVMCCDATGTVEWNGVRWSTPVAGGPSPRTHQATAYDGASHRVLVFGGGVGSPLPDTWAWDGSTWSNVTTTPSPSARWAAAMAYDSVRHRAVLFGGFTSTNVARADTWEWDGAAWHDVTTSSSPPAMGAVVAGTTQGAPVMAFDQARERIVLFGGAPSSETWEWDGVTWTERVSASIPGPFEYPAMVYDRARGRVVLLGGTTASYSQWEWDGANWTQPSIVSIVPDPEIEVAAAYDEVRSEIVKFGGMGVAPDDNITWLGTYRGPDEEICSSGVDVDRDGKIGCADEDCAVVCVHCGDGTCSSIENDRLCPADCPATPAICGDAYCAPSETVATCAADCL
jgi:cysteine-rich repeat protein